MSTRCVPLALRDSFDLTARLCSSRMCGACALTAFSFTVSQLCIAPSNLMSDLFLNTRSAKNSWYTVLSSRSITMVGITRSMFDGNFAKLFLNEDNASFCSSASSQSTLNIQSPVHCSIA